MAYALVTVDKAVRNQPWPTAMHFYVHEMPTDAGVTRLNEGAWLLNLDTELLVLANIVRIAYESSLPIQVLFFDQKPQFSTLAGVQKA